MHIQGFVRQSTKLLEHLLVRLNQSFDEVLQSVRHKNWHCAQICNVLCNLRRGAFIVGLFFPCISWKLYFTVTHCSSIAFLCFHYNRDPPIFYQKMAATPL